MMRLLSICFGMTIVGITMLAQAATTNTVVSPISSSTKAISIPSKQNMSPIADANSSPRLLFVLMADKGEIEPIGKGEYSVVLNNVRKQVIYFTNQPMKLSRNMSVADFMHFWQADASKVRPSVAVEGVLDNKQGNDAERNFVLTIDKPEYLEDKATLTLRGKLRSDKPLDKATTMHDLTLFLG